jgi:hypothetical protein
VTLKLILVQNYQSILLRQENTLGNRDKIEVLTSFRRPAPNVEKPPAYSPDTIHRNLDQLEVDPLEVQLELDQFVKHLSISHIEPLEYNIGPRSSNEKSPGRRTLNNRSLSPGLPSSGFRSRYVPRFATSLPRKASAPAPPIVTPRLSRRSESFGFYSDGDELQFGVRESFDLLGGLEWNDPRLPDDEQKYQTTATRGNSESTLSMTFPGPSTSRLLTALRDSCSFSLTGRCRLLDGALYILEDAAIAIGLDHLPDNVRFANPSDFRTEWFSGDILPGLTNA